MSSLPPSSPYRSCQSEPMCLGRVRQLKRNQLNAIYTNTEQGWAELFLRDQLVARSRSSRALPCPLVSISLSLSLSASAPASLPHSPLFASPLDSHERTHALTHSHPHTNLRARQSASPFCHLFVAFLLHKAGAMPWRSHNTTRIARSFRLRHHHHRMLVDCFKQQHNL